VFLYNPSTEKYVKKKVHINRIKPCNQRDDIPENDEVFEDMTIVEMTYPQVYLRTPQPLPMQEIDTQAEDHTNQTPTKNDTPQIIKQPTTDNDSREAQHKSLSPDNHNGISTENAVYHDANQFWNALKIMRQSTGKGKTQYLIKWKNITAPDSWSDALDVNHELKRVFYLTHKKTGSKRVHPLYDTAHPTLAMILECNALNFIQCKKVVSD